MNRIRRATWMRLSLLDRWLLKELLGPLLFFIVLFTLLLLTGGVMFELIRKIVDKNLPVGIAAQVLILSVPPLAGLFDSDRNADGLVVCVHPTVIQQRADRSAQPWCHHHSDDFGGTSPVSRHDSVQLRPQRRCCPTQ